MARYDKNRAPRRVQKKQEAKSEQQQSEDHHSSDERKQEGIQPTESIDETSEVIQHDSMPTIIHWIPGSVIQIPESAGPSASSPSPLPGPPPQVATGRSQFQS